MLYAKVNEEGKIQDVATEQSDDYKLLVAPDEPAVAAILEKKFSSTTADTQEMLSNSDSDMLRIIEDLIDLLTEKRLIRFTELPIPAQKKLLSRKWVRNVHNGFDDTLIADEEGIDGDSLI